MRVCVCVDYGVIGWREVFFFRLLDPSEWESIQSLDDFLFSFWSCERRNKTNAWPKAKRNGCGWLWLGSGFDWHTPTGFFLSDWPFDLLRFRTASSHFPFLLPVSIRSRYIYTKWICNKRTLRWLNRIVSVGLIESYLRPTHLWSCQSAKRRWFYTEYATGKSESERK